MDPPLPNSLMIWWAASVPGCPGSEKSTTSREAAVFAGEDPADEQQQPPDHDELAVSKDELSSTAHEREYRLGL